MSTAKIFDAYFLYEYILLQKVERGTAMSATKYSHPFLNGLKPLPEGYEEELQQLREW